MNTDETRIKAKESKTASSRKGESAEGRQRERETGKRETLSQSPVLFTSFAFIALSLFQAFAMMLSCCLCLYPCFIRVHPWLDPFYLRLCNRCKRRPRRVSARLTDR